ncbi:N-acetyltransferase [Roseobacter denitrificans]|uniref:Acetyltransferase, putative n=1 Tax=Roseobacter denitrificans (strain ATCC 33942 / OCh 114) TaxID=375451 RepID=Q16B15_ROSDO|nr:GNAT family protein [Roseobacter denitrificans]ABG30828.1 acetyltransferase, putative [Roseobacter denitrificans OCh 114]AVL53933.1 N-acetyltransferase [Roseobacter denitrificans]SFG15667.1 Protein N-acetyltransferase, RimJ/RimL family [Roseobacter denitrificans OCh 114]
MPRSTSQSPVLGMPVPNWSVPDAPQGISLIGRYAELHLLDADLHGAALFDAYSGHDQIWDYLPYGPFETATEFKTWVKRTISAPIHQFYAIKNKESGVFEGVASYLRIDPANGSIEVGHINYSPALQRTRAGTEAMYLMMQNAFGIGFRRYEWKCNALNLGSRRAAQRLGFSYEGVFRQATVSKGRNRDTAWFAIIDQEWPALRRAFETWLAPENFEQGRQLTSLGDLTRTVRVTSDPLL